jgi:hypothetical protein
MTLIEFYKRYDIWAFLFTIFSGLLVYLFIRFGEWILFLIRTYRRVKYLNVNCWIGRDESNYPCKLYIDFRNWTNTTILLKIEGFKLRKGVHPEPKATRDSSTGLLEIKFIERVAQSGDQTATLNIDSIIRHGENKEVWVPLHPDQTDEMLLDTLQRGKIGKLKAQILWFSGKPRLRRYRPKIRRT